MSSCDDPRFTPGRLAAFATGFTLTTYAVLLGDIDLVYVIAGKEQLLEQLSAGLFLTAGILAFVARKRSTEEHRRRRRLVYLLLGVFFCVVFGEEISWGQHWLGFETPEAIKEINVQNEVNFHNLWIFDVHPDAGKERKRGLAALLTANRLFDAFMLGSFLVLPWARRWAPLAGLMARFGVRPPPVWLGAPLILNLALTVIAEVWRVDGKILHLAVSEIRECNYALLCAVGMLASMRAETAASRRSAGQSEGFADR